MIQVWENSPREIQLINDWIKLDIFTLPGRCFLKKGLWDFPLAQFYLA